MQALLKALPKGSLPSSPEAEGRVGAASLGGLADPELPMVSRWAGFAAPGVTAAAVGTGWGPP